MRGDLLCGRAVGGEVEHSGSFVRSTPYDLRAILNVVLQKRVVIPLKF